MPTVRTIAVVALIASLVPTLAVAAEPVTVETQVRSVALFKNGLGFFTRAGELPAAPAEIEVGPLPTASHGTLWLGWDQPTQFDHLRAREATGYDSRVAGSIAELLEANVGKRVRLEFGSEFRPPVEGVLTAVPKARQPAPPNPYMPVQPPPASEASVVLVQTETGMVAVDRRAVERIVFLEEPQTTVADETQRTVLSGALTGGRAGGPFSVSYLAKGMTWAPSYLVDISDAEEALLTAKAVVINEIEDVAEVHVDLITGFPHLEFAEIISPLAKKQDLAAFLNSLYRGGDAQYRGRAATMAQVTSNVAMMGEAGQPMPDYGAPAQGTVAEDLFYYPLEGVTLARGETGYYPLFSERVDYEHIYEWDIPDYIDDDERYRRPEEIGPQVVWHSLRLTNDTPMPWTTAPAEIVQEGRILGQGMLKYTARGGETLVKITQALGIKADELELEIARERNALVHRGAHYDLVTVQGTLTMRSHMDKAVTVRVTKLITGEMQEGSPEAEVVKLAAGLRGVNPHSRLTWELALPDGDELELSYTYTVYIRS